MKTKEIGQKKVVSLVGLITLALAVQQTVVRAEVVDSSAGGFTIKASATIKATPADVYNKLVHNIGDWWNSGHTFSGDAHNLSIEERSAGCFCEKLKDGGGVRHMEVVFFQPGKVLRLTGGLGPFQTLPVSGVATFNLSAVPEGTKLELTYGVGGYYPQGLNVFAATADQVLTEQVIRLKRYIETGDPAGKETK